MKSNDRNWALGTVAVALLTMAPPAFAYLDPSTGSMILSAVVGLFATAALAVKTYWYRLKAFFRQRDPEEPVEADKAQSGTSVGAEPSADH